MLSAPRGRLIVQAAAGQQRAALTLMDMVGPAAEYRAFLSERAAKLTTATESFEQAQAAGDTAAAGKARSEAATLLPALRPATSGDAELEALFAKLQAALSSEAADASAEPRQAAEAFRAALSQRTVLPDRMLAGAITLLSPQEGETGSAEDIAAASGIARLLLPLTARIDPDLAARAQADLVALPAEAKPGGATRKLADDLAAMRKALVLPETERKS